MNRVLVSVNVTGLIIGISYGLHGPALPIFAKNIIDASYSELGLIGLANFLPYMFIPLFVGILLDRFNKGYLLALGSIVNAVSIYLLSIAQSVPEILGFRIMTGIAHAFFWPPCEAIISSHSSSQNRVRNISWFTLFFVTGFMTGPLIGVMLLEDADATYRTLFQITSLIVTTTIISALFASRDRTTPYREKFGLSSIMEMKKFPEVIILIMFCTSSFGLVISIYPAFLNDNGMSDTNIMLLYFIFGISRVTSLAFAEKLAVKTSTTLIFATAAISAGMMVSVMADSMIMFTAALLLLGFGLSVFFPLTLEIILSRTRKNMSGRIIGAYETVFGMGWMMGPLFGGSTTQSFGDKAPYLILGIVGIGITMMTIMSRKKLELKKAHT